MEDRRDLIVFRELYEGLVQRYKSIGKICNVNFERKYLNADSDILLFLRSYENLELPKITSRFMDINLDNLVDMEIDLIAVEQRFKFLTKYR